MKRFSLTFAFLALASIAGFAQMPGGDMAGMAGTDHKDTAAAGAVNESMSREMSMGPHMLMTEVRAPNADDQKRADAIVAKLRSTLEKYRDYHVALEDGFQPFLPNVPQKIYHFTNYSTAFMEYLQFRPAHPGSLLYEKTRDGYRLVGAMYSAPADSTLEELDERVPLSVAQWHKHVNLCVPPKGHADMWRKTSHGKPLFGPAGTIATQAECEAAGGNWIPHLFGWMVHVYPFSDDPKQVWSTDPDSATHGGESQAAAAR
jgi:hypothetical protein